MHKTNIASYTIETVENTSQLWWEMKMIFFITLLIVHLLDLNEKIICTYTCRKVSTTNELL